MLETSICVKHVLIYLRLVVGIMLQPLLSDKLVQVLYFTLLRVRNRFQTTSLSFVR